MNKPKEQRRKVLNIPCKAVFMGANSSSIENLKQFRTGKVFKKRAYHGGFPSSVIQIIKELIFGQVLNLYSGASDIGNVRVDLKCSEATHKMSVEEYISKDGSYFDWVIIDPPYKIRRPEHLKNFASARPLSGNALIKDRLRLYLRQNANNVLWLDYCSPTIKGFERKYIWLIMPGNCWEHVRIFTWLNRAGDEMVIRPAGNLGRQYKPASPNPGPEYILALPNPAGNSRGQGSFIVPRSEPA